MIYFPIREKIDEFDLSEGNVEISNNVPGKATLYFIGT